jgi:SnoaL-like polyketide cyclase
VSSEAEENKAIVRRFLEGTKAKGNLDVIDELAAPNFVDRSLMPGQGPTREDYKLSMKESNDAFPITSITIEEQVAEGDTLQLSPVWSDRTVTEGERRRSEWRR